MARLKHTQAGHYIILGPDFPEGAIVTRQISSEGVEWLEQRGISVDDQVPQDLIIQLKELEFVWTGGGGVEIDTRRAPEPQFPEKSLKALEKWSPQGDPQSFMKVLHEACQGVSLRECFDPKFLSWVIGLEAACAPKHLFELAPQEIYENFFTQNLTQFPRLHTQLLDRERGRWVLCHWMKWTSEVWQQKMQRGACPDLWRGNVHEVIFQLVCDLERPRTIEPPPWKKSIPYVRLRGDEVELVVPSQRGPQGGRLDFYLNETLTPLPLKKERQNWVWGEQIYPLRDPETPVRWACYYSHADLSNGDIMGRFPPARILLFQENGTFLRPGSAARVATGRRYLILFHEEAHSEVISRGINLDEERLLDQPVGWWDWLTYHINVPEQLENLGSYTFEQPRTALSLSLPPPPAYPVDFFHQVPVYLGDWPLIHLENVADDILLKVTIESETNQNLYEKLINEGTIPDLNHLAELRQAFGLVTIKAQGLSPIGYNHQETQFLRLPEWDFCYTQDPTERGTRALIIAGISEGRVLPMDNCQLWPKEQGALLVAIKSPLVNPVVSLAWENPHQQKHIPFSVRLPVNRGAILERGGKLPIWQDLPLTADPDFLTSTREGEIRLELMDPLPQGEVWLKASGDRSVHLGQPLGRIVRLPCHRLRDYLGFRFLTLYLKTTAGWQPILHQAEEVQPVGAPPEPPEWAGLVTALWQVDPASLRDIWEKAKVTIGPSDIEVLPQALFLGPHLGDWDGVEKIFENTQVMEVEILRLRSHLRQLSLSRQDFDDLRALVAALPPDSYQKHAKGEWWYRMARNHWTHAPGALHTSYRCLSRGSWGDPVTAAEAYCLAAMVALLGNGEVPQGPPGAPSPNPYSVLFQECSRFLKTAWEIGSKIKLPETPQPLTIILAPQDVLFFNACLALMRQEVDHAASFLDQASEYVHTLPAAYTLLQARKHRLRGERKLALYFYRIINEDFPFVLDEMYS